MEKEQWDLELDKYAYMYGRVVNKKARWNICFDNKPQAPDYENKKGRVIAYDNVPILKYVYNLFGEYFGNKAIDLKGEGNYYYDEKCGIGYHGDAERRRVLALRIGRSMPLYYRWYKEGKIVGKEIKIEMNCGDIYVMSEKAVGTDWKKKKCFTLRHSTGDDKYTHSMPKVKKNKIKE